MLERSAIIEKAYLKKISSNLEILSARLILDTSTDLLLSIERGWHKVLRLCAVTDPFHTSKASFQIDGVLGYVKLVRIKKMY